MRPTDAYSHISPGQRAWLLFWVSVLGLFVELMLIRWIGTEIRIFAYLQNTILVVCFLGLGMGCWTAKKPANIPLSIAAFVAVVALLSVPWLHAFMADITRKLSLLSDFHIWHAAEGQDAWHMAQELAVGLGLTLVFMALVWEIFIPIGRLLARLMDDHPRPIAAYSANIAGSLVGILAFVAASAFGLPPYLWCAIAAALYLPFIDRWPTFCAVGLAATIGLGSLTEYFPNERPMGWEESTSRIRSVEQRWSPYQKLNLRSLEQPNDGRTYVRYGLLVNDSPYMDFKDLRPDEVARHEKLFDPKMRGLSQYDIPLRVQPKPGKMLVVGSGGGNDVAGGLRGGAKEIVAVEIDPAIIELGMRHHPEHPYSTPKVRVVNDDARAYFANTSDKFDLIVFGLLDSHTTTAMTNSRLDHYVYTVESLEAAKKLLNPGGIVVLSFEANKHYIVDRMATALRQVFGTEPIYFRVPISHYGFGGVVFVVGDPSTLQARIDNDPPLKAAIEGWKKETPFDLPGKTTPCTDDWPYIYLTQPSIPSIFAVLALLMLILFLYGLRRLRTPNLLAGWSGLHWHFFFLGAAFMLLEVQNISKAAVALGNTWEVNAVMIGSILLLILFANLIVSLAPRLPLLPIYLLLIGSCVGLYFVDLAHFAYLPYVTRAAVVGGLASLPMFFSGIIFMRSFAEAPAKDSALGANLLGSLIGGLLQAVTFLTGLKALLLIVAGLYFMAFLTRPRAASIPNLGAKG